MAGLRRFLRGGATSGSLVASTLESTTHAALLIVLLGTGGSGC